MYICPRRRHKELYRHLIRFHRLTISCAEKICRAIQNKDPPNGTTLFQSDEIIVDQINHFFCPFSIHNPHTPSMINTSERSCRCTKPQLPNVLTYHLIRDHRMSLGTAKRVVKKLKAKLVL